MRNIPQTFFWNMAGFVLLSTQQQNNLTNSESYESHVTAAELLKPHDQP